ncbi:hypothetical protein U9M48_001712, partial [Paspalum notatum var. saurae]
RRFQARVCLLLPSETTEEVPRSAATEHLKHQCPWRHPGRSALNDLLCHDGRKLGARKPEKSPFANRASSVRISGDDTSREITG